MRRVLAIVLGLALLAAAPLTAVAQSKGEIVIGMQCDRTGATQLVGVVVCPRIHDYINLVNSKGGIEGYAVKALEIDHEYKVPPGMA
jgi:branched-chain amino acid transport system substrate-binding protein